MGKKDITLLSVQTRHGEARCVRTPSSIRYILFHPEYDYGKIMKVLTLDPGIPLDTHRKKFIEWIQQDLNKRKFIQWD